MEAVSAKGRSEPGVGFEIHFPPIDGALDEKAYEEAGRLRTNDFTIHIPYWPLPRTERLRAIDTPEVGRFAIDVRTDRRIEVQQQFDGVESSLISGPLKLRVGTVVPLRVDLLGGDEKRIWVAGPLVGLTGRPSLENTEYEFAGLPVGSPPDDIDEQNAAARARRATLRAGSSPRPGRTAATPAQRREQLHCNLLQLRDLVDLCRQGRMHHIYGVASRLRILLADPFTKHQQPLVQGIAAAYDTALTVRARLPMPIPGGEGANLLRFHRPSIVSSGFPFETYGIDIDVWLARRGATAGGVEYSNLQVLKAVGDTKASHSDPDLEPLVEMLEEHAGAYGGTVIPELCGWLLQVADVTLEVGWNLYAKTAPGPV